MHVGLYRANNEVVAAMQAVASATPKDRLKAGARHRRALAKWDRACAILNCDRLGNPLPRMGLGRRI